MINAILAEKKEMGQAFLKDGSRIPVTKVQAGPCLITGVKTSQKDGYEAVQLGFGATMTKRLTKPLAGHLKNATWPEGKGHSPRVLREVRIAQVNEEKRTVGSTIKANEIFKVGDVVNVTGISKGRGFTGVMKRWGFKGGPKTHGQSDRQRAPGSIGQTTTPGRVYKGKKMAGRSGQQRITIRNLQVVRVDEQGEVWIKGLVPGERNGIVIIKKVSTAAFAGLVDESDEGQPTQDEKKADKEKSRRKEEKVEEKQPEPSQET